MVSKPGDDARTEPARDAPIGPRWFPSRWGPILWWLTLVGFLSLLVVVVRVDTKPWDLSVTRWAVASRSDALTRLAVVMSWLGLVPVVAVWAGAAAAMLDWRFRTSWRCVIRVAVVLCVDVPVVAAVKGLVDRPRPSSSIRLVSVSTPSFPSGHAAATTAAVTVLVLSVIAVTRSRKARVCALAAGVLIVVAVDWSRVYLGVHYLTDVVAGTLLGVWLALSVAWLSVAMADRRGARSRSSARNDGSSAPRPPDI